MLEIPACNICGSSEVEVIKEEVAKGNASKLVICKKCGLAFLSPRWDKDGYTEYYKSSYDDSYRPDISSFEEFSKLNDKNSICERLKAGSYFKESFKKALDIGSGEGKNLYFISKYFDVTDLYAIEPSEISQKILEKNNVKFISDDVDSGWEKEHKSTFDVILMRHVLEHFLNPLEALRRIRSSLTTEGIIYIAVPNNLNRNRLNGWARIPHTYYFNRFSLPNIVKMAGFEILEMKEGDSMNNHEIYLVAKKSEEGGEPLIDSENYKVQKEVFLSVMRKEKSFGHKLKKLARAIKKS